MSWIKVHNGLVSNKKTARLAGKMKWKKLEAVGFLVSFWIWAVENCEDGQLGDITDTEIGFAVGMENCEGILTALISSGLIDKEPLQIHKWVGHQYEYLRAKYRNSPDKLQQILDIARYKHGTTPVQARIDKIREDKRDKKDIRGGEADPPTLSQVRDYREAEHLKADPDKFHAWQSSKGWAGVIDWKAAFRYWDRTEYPDKSTQLPVLPKINPADIHKENMDSIDHANAWHDKHMAGGKCSFCKTKAVGLATCKCKAYTDGFNKHMEKAKT